MRPDKKEARRIYMSVEGKNCEAMYFKHLEDLINEHFHRNYSTMDDFKKEILTFAK